MSGVRRRSPGREPIGGDLEERQATAEGDPRETIAETRKKLESFRGLRAE